MSGLRFPDAVFDDLRSDLLGDTSREACGVGYASYNVASNSWVVREAAPVPDDAYEQRTAMAATLSTSFVVDVANRCRRAGEAVVLIHTHPRSPGAPTFSPIDDSGEAKLASYFARRAGPAHHVAMVVGPEGCRARLLGGDREIPVWQVGRDLVLRSNSLACGKIGEAQFDRQVRAFGEPGQRILRDLRVAVIGAGGTGSVVTQQLAHLGVGELLVIDPDLVEATNLNRLVGASPGDVGRHKVDVVARSTLSVNPAARVNTLRRDVVDDDVGRLLAGYDIVFSCTDSHASRMVVCQVAYQHLVPAIDMGVSITVADGRITHVTGRVQMLAPGLECLVCGGALDTEAIRRETMTDEQRRADPYVQGAREPQPAVISLNTTMASLAVTMFLGAVTPVPASARFQYYDGIRGTVRPTSATRDPHCILCSASGALARGVSRPLFTRPAPAGREETAA